MELFISPAGNDAWSGRLREANASGTDGPLASLEGARRAIRARREPSRFATSLGVPTGALDWPLVVWIAGGRYEMHEPVVFGLEDAAPIVFKALPGQSPVFDGGARLSGWQQVTRNGVPMWQATWDARWDARQLWVEGRRAPRARWPKSGFLRLLDPLNGANTGWGSKGTNRFVVDRADWNDSWRVTQSELVALHFWIEERLPVSQFDPATGLVVSSKESCAPLVDAWNGVGAPYYLENVVETLSEPGEWGVDLEGGWVFYVPEPGQSPETTEIVVAVTPQLLVLRGAPEAGRFVEWLRFEGLTFRHTSALSPGDPNEPAARLHATDPMYRGDRYAAAPQGAVDVPGAIYWSGARNCSLVNCVVERTGWYGLELEAGCRYNSIQSNVFRDLGAGGIKVNGAESEQDGPGLSSHNTIGDNSITAFGRVYHSGVGILIRHSGWNRVCHNEIRDGYYTGISVGWHWSYRDNVSHGNILEFNHISHLGQGLLSDMGGIYLLGSAPGTVIRYNLIHDIQCAKYGGWAIYPDEGSSYLVIENNVCFRTSSAVFHQHWGHENMVRNNIFAFGGEGIIAYSKADAGLGFTLLNNILIASGSPIYVGGYAHDVEVPGAFFADLNVLWDTTGSACIAANKTSSEQSAQETSLTWNQWQSSGRDRRSVLVDPQIIEFNPLHIEPTSPVWSLGFRPIDLTNVGPHRIRC